MRVAGLAFMGALLVGGCGLRTADEVPNLMNLSTPGRGPDEFAILPSKPLETPPDYAALPPPTPGGANRTDRDPNFEVAQALGATARGYNRPAPASDNALLAHATRYGVTDNIRRQLAAEDLAFRQQNNGRVLERWFSVPVYFKAYADQSLDQQAELERWRLRGVRTSAVPPDPERFNY